MPFARSSGNRMSARYRMRTMLSDELPGDLGKVACCGGQRELFEKQLMPFLRQAMAQIAIAPQRADGIGQRCRVSRRTRPHVLSVDEHLASSGRIGRQHGTADGERVEHLVRDDARGAGRRPETSKT